MSGCGSDFSTFWRAATTLTPEWLRDKTRALAVVDAVVSLAEVAGNQSRFLYDFSPDAVLFRWTDDFAPRFLYGFTLTDSQPGLRADVVQRVESGDIDALELIIGGSIAAQPGGHLLRQKGAAVHEGIKAAADALKQQMRHDLKLT